MQRSANVSVTNIQFGVRPPDRDGHSTAEPPASTPTDLSASASSASIAAVYAPKMEQDDPDSEAELTQLGHPDAATASVRLRARSAFPVNGDALSVPRPMSWEGELSDAGSDDADDDDGMPDERRTPQRFRPTDDGPMVKIETDPPDPQPAAPAGRSPAAHSVSMAARKAPSGPPSSAGAGAPAYPPANQSPDSAIHSVYTHSSPSQSPINARHNALYAPSLSRNNSDASHSSCYSYSSEFGSPTHSPVQGRHPSAGAFAFNASPLHHSVLYRPLKHDHPPPTNAEPPPEGGSTAQLSVAGPSYRKAGAQPDAASGASCDSFDPGRMYEQLATAAAGSDFTGIASASFSAGISRQQLINSPCPICGDKISGFHYGIFSCESCKGFFKRTVQNRKNYVCLRGAACPVTIATRKKCPACRFDKCLQRGMKLEAIREDRTRGGRSTYQCAYALPGAMLSPPLVAQPAHPRQPGQTTGASMPSGGQPAAGALAFGGAAATNATPDGCDRDGAHLAPGNEQEPQRSHYHPVPASADGESGQHAVAGAPGAFKWLADKSAGAAEPASSADQQPKIVPTLLQEIMDVEHLWQYRETERGPTVAHRSHSNSSGNSSSSGGCTANAPGDGPSGPSSVAPVQPLPANANVIANLCNVADHRLYKIVKWCKSLPLFKNISLDDQICLLINSWCELLLFSCCYRSIETPGEVRISFGKSISLAQAKVNGLQACIERMLNLTDHLRRLRVDQYEYVAMKVIVLLQSDTSELKEPEKVRGSQEKALQALQAYTLSHYAESPAKFGELLLRIPELQRTCQIGKEMLTIKSKDGEDFNLLMELLRGEH